MRARCEATGQSVRATLRPQTQAILKATVAAYQADRTDFLNLLDSQNTTLEVELNYIKAASELETRMADLEHAVGKLPRPVTASTELQTPSSLSTAGGAVMTTRERYLIVAGLVLGLFIVGVIYGVSRLLRLEADRSAKGASSFDESTVSLKRYPDTNPGSSPGSNPDTKPDLSSKTTEPAASVQMTETSSVHRCADRRGPAPHNPP